MTINDVPELPEKYVKRFWSRVAQKGPDDCWPFRGKSMIISGHIQFNYNTQKIYSHRVAYKLTYGSNLEGILVCHTCDNPVCCNPKHLFLGTSQDNNKDAVSKGRHSCLHIDHSKSGNHGPNCYNSKLTLQQLTTIRFEKSIGFTLKMLSDKYNISQASLSRALNGKTYK